MFRFKIYTKDKIILDKVCKDYNLDSEYTLNTGEPYGYGYVASEGKLLVFTEGSHVDLDDNILDISCDYIPNYISRYL